MVKLSRSEVEEREENELENTELELEKTQNVLIENMGDSKEESISVIPYDLPRTFPDLGINI
jgi:hypothetical protein